MRTIITVLMMLFVSSLLGAALARAQVIPDVHCVVEDYPVRAVVAWQFPETLSKVQVAVLRDPSGEQEARFDLLHGATLISLRYRGKELLFGHTAGASVAMFATRRGDEAELKGMSPYWSAFNPDQAGSSMGVPATTAGVACQGQSSMRAIAMMVDRGVNNSFQKEPLLGLWMGQISQNFPPGYSSSYAIETNASWVEHPGGGPRYYLKLDQTVVHIRPDSDGTFEWFLTGASPWEFDYKASYPENCAEKTPCSSASAPALAIGRYEDRQRNIGVATVVPTGAWNTDRAFLNENAEYVVLLYGAVWAAPRHTYATVLSRALPGVRSFHFSWYVCAGPWDRTQDFARAIKQEKTNEAPPVAAEPPRTPPDHDAVRVACQTTEFRMQPNQPDQAIVLKDPAGEQTALFDTTQGGALVSLKYRGVEHIWGYNGGGLLQMAFHNRRDKGSIAGDYNPTQAGDGSAMSPVTGIACDGTQTADIVAMILDFNHNNGFYDKPLIAVWGGRVNDMVPLTYFSPYTLEIRASWVPNPAGEPKYYLRLDDRLTHIADEKIGAFTYDFADYALWEFNVRAVDPENCPCDSSRTKYMVGGWYQDESRRTGLAIAMPSVNFPGGKVSGLFNSDYMWRNRNFHLGASEPLDGISSKAFTWFVMAGPWSNAKAFAQKPLP